MDFYSSYKKFDKEEEKEETKSKVEVKPVVAKKPEELIVSPPPIKKPVVQENFDLIVTKAVGESILNNAGTRPMARSLKRVKFDFSAIDFTDKQYQRLLGLMSRALIPGGSIDQSRVVGKNTAFVIK